MKFPLIYNQTKHLNKSLLNSIVSNYNIVFRYNKGNMGDRRHIALLFKVDFRHLSILNSFTSFNYSLIHNHVLSNYYIPGTL